MELIWHQLSGPLPGEYAEAPEAVELRLGAAAGTFARLHGEARAAVDGPLAQAAESWRSGPERSKWLRLQKDLDGVGARCAELQGQVAELDAQVEAALSDGADPGKLEAKRLKATAELEVAGRRRDTLAGLAARAKAEAEATLRDALSKKRQGLLAHFRAEYCQALDDLVAAVAGTYPELWRATAAVGWLSSHTADEDVIRPLVEAEFPPPPDTAPTPAPDDDRYRVGQQPNCPAC